MAGNDLALMAHLMRRAGFGATREELETLGSREYEEVVEDLLHPERFPEVEEDIVDRYYGGESVMLKAAVWIYRMVNTRRPLEEKMALFWHHVFATGWGKLDHPVALAAQIQMFRRTGLSEMRTILLELSKDPAMNFWLDNCENHGNEPNENYGRELLELFSMGVGNYTEQDLKMAARAFTGWTFKQPPPLYPHGNYPTEFLYREDDHDDSIKTFLGETGPFNGEEIVEIISKQPAAARFISRHLYNFFVADEPQVPAWNTVPPQDPDAIDALEGAYFESGGELRSMLRVLFNSDFFKEARFKRVKSPAELVAGVTKLVGSYRSPEPPIMELDTATTVMGQKLMDPPTVEGWHTGKEWIDGGTLNERINFAVNQVADGTRPGIRQIIDSFAGEDNPVSPEEFADRCVELAGPVAVGDDTREALLRHARSGGPLGFDGDEQSIESAGRVVRMLQLIVSTREYQLA